MVVGLLAEVHEKESAPREKPLVKLIRACVQQADKLSVLFMLCGIFGLLLLPQVDRKAKFDEKSLMVGGVMPTFRNSPTALTTGLAFVHAVRELQYSATPNTTMAALIRDRLAASGLEAFITPSAEPVSSSRESSCLNVHSVLKAPQTDGSEALLLVTPVAITNGSIQGRPADWDAPAAGAPLLLGAILALLHHLKTVTWLSRDIVWVVPDARCGATASLLHWADQYHGTGYWHSTPPAQQGSSSGTLQQALILQADRPDFTTAEVLVEGFEGQLPKLDTYLVLRELLYVFPDIQLLPPHQAPALAAVHQTVHDMGLGSEVAEHLDKLGHMLSFMWRQTLGLPSGPHAALKTFMLDAATTRFSAHAPGGTRLPVPTSPSPGARVPPLPKDLPSRLLYMAEYAELVLRSFNNLDERFHHSFFLYLLTHEYRFVTVEMYIIPLILLIGVLLLKASKLRDTLRGGQQQATVSTAALGSGQEGSSSTEPGVASDTQQALLGDAQTRNSGQTDAVSVPDLQPGYFWPVSFLLAFALVAVVLGSGLLLRMWLCPACQLCTYKVGHPSCAQAEQRCADGSGSASATAGSCTSPGLRQGPNTLQRLSGTEQLVLGLSALLLVGTLGWEAAGLVSRVGRLGHEVVEQEGAGDGKSEGGTASDVFMGVQVVLLCVAAIMLAGMASVNWALAYVVALSLSLVCVLGPVHRPVSGVSRSSTPQPPSKGLNRVMCGVTMLCVSPFTLLLLMGVSRLPSNVGSFGQDDAWTDCRTSAHRLPWCLLRAAWHNRHAVLCCSWINTYAFTWAAFVPLWVFKMLEWASLMM